MKKRVVDLYELAQIVKDWIRNRLQILLLIEANYELINLLKGRPQKRANFLTPHPFLSTTAQFEGTPSLKQNADVQIYIPSIQCFQRFSKK